MPDPATDLFLASLGLNAIGGLYSSSGLKEAGRARRRALEFQAKVDLINAEFVRKATEEQVRLATAEGRRVMANQRAAASVSGATSDFDRFFLETMQNTYDDVRAIMWEGRVEEFNLKQSSKAKVLQGKAEEKAGYAAARNQTISTGADILGGAAMFFK